jgi:acyl carrier protein
MTTLEKLHKILDDSLQLGRRASALSAEDRLLGAIPEFDSMAVVAVITAIEQEFGISVDDDELSAEVFETLGSLERFVSAKVAG